MAAIETYLFVVQSDLLEWRISRDIGYYFSKFVENKVFREDQSFIMPWGYSGGDAAIIIISPNRNEHLAHLVYFHYFSREVEIVENILFFGSPRLLENDTLLRFRSEELYRRDEFVRDYGEFVTFFARRLYYDRLFFGAISEFSEQFTSLLIEINEIAALNHFRQKVQLLERSLRIPSLEKRLLHDNESYLSYMSLGRILEKRSAGHGPAPLQLTFFVDVSIDKELGFTFDFSMEHKGTQAINALIGPNGIGKTRALIEIANQVRSESPIASWPARTVVYSHDRTVFRGRLPHEDIFSFAPTKANWKKLTNVLANFAAANSPYARPFEVLERLLSDVLPLSNVYLPLKDIEDQSIYRKAISRNGNPYVSFQDCMESGGVRAVLFRTDRAPLLRNRDGSFSIPSSGEMSLFLFLASILIECNQGSLILIDEPENHLHPQFISMLMRKLNGVLIDTDSRAIVVTHSPFVIRELDKRAVTVMQHDSNGEIALYTPTLQTHGGNVSMISYYVFGDEFIKKGYEELIDNLVEVDWGDANSVMNTIEENFGADGISYFLSKNRKSNGLG